MFLRRVVIIYFKWKQIKERMIGLFFFKNNGKLKFNRKIDSDHIV